MFQWRLRQKNKSPSNLYESESVIHTDSIFAQQTHRYRVLHTHVSSKLFDSLQLMTYILFSQHYFFSHVLMVVLSGTMLCNMSLAPSPTVCMSIIASVTHSINLTLRIITALQYWASREQGRDWENKDKTKDRISHFSHFWEAVLFIKKHAHTQMHVHYFTCTYKILFCTTYRCTHNHPVLILADAVSCAGRGDWRLASAVCSWKSKLNFHSCGCMHMCMCACMHMCMRTCTLSSVRQFACKCTVCIRWMHPSLWVRVDFFGLHGRNTAASMNYWKLLEESQKHKYIVT